MRGVITNPVFGGVAAVYEEPCTVETQEAAKLTIRNKVVRSKTHRGYGISFELVDEITVIKRVRVIIGVKRGNDSTILDMMESAVENHASVKDTIKFLRRKVRKSGEKPEGAVIEFTMLEW